jgi:hypothetical protein
LESNFDLFVILLLLICLSIWWFIENTKVKKLELHTDRLVLSAISFGYQVELNRGKGKARQVVLTKELEIDEWKKFLAPLTASLADFQFEMGAYVFYKHDFSKCLIRMSICHGVAIWEVNSPFLLDRSWTLASSDILNEQVIEDREETVQQLGRTDPVSRLENFIKSYEKNEWHPFEEWHDRYKTEYQRYKDLYEILSKKQWPDELIPEPTVHIKSNP